MSLLEDSLGDESLLPFVLDAKNEDGRSLLHAAAAARNVEAIKMLLEKGADPTTPDEVCMSESVGNM